MSDTAVVGASGWVHEARRNAGMLIVLGVLEVLFGIVAIAAPMISGLAVSLIVAVLLLIAGITRIFSAFKAGSFGAGALAFLGGLLALLGGVMVLARPALGLLSLTLLLAIYFFADGLARMLLGFKMKPEQGWGWTVFCGLISLVLGVMIWRQWPSSAAWLVGTLIGVHFLFTGWGLIWIGIAGRSSTERTSS